MNIIPKINGNYEIMSNKKFLIQNLNIIDNNNLFSNNTLDLVRQKFSGTKKTCATFVPSKDNVYKINIAQGDIIVETSKDLAYNALMTLWNLKDDLYKDMFITDFPKFAHREFSIDVARHYFSVDEIKKLIDEAANLKLNKIHLHLSDNQGFRVESKKYPLLNDIGGKDGFYTIKELKDLVAFANDRHIEIIPEIDIPGHVGAILASYPDLSCRGKSNSLDEGYKRNDKTLCFGNNKSLDFVKDLLDEIMDIFPSKHIHIGCDELDLTHNKKCPKCKEFMKRNGFSSLNEVIINFINQVATYIMDNKREVIVWNDATKYGQLDARIIIQNWFDYPFDKSNLNEYNNNRRFIFGSTIHTYFDYPMSLVTLENTYNFSPRINNSLLYGPNILGTSSHIWTEIINNDKSIEEKIFPRLVAFSESAWSNESNYNDFLKRLEYYLQELEKRGIFYTSPLNISKDESTTDIANYFKSFLNNSGGSFSAYQSMVGAKLVSKLLSESNHMKDIPAIALKLIKK